MTIKSLNWRIDREHSDEIRGQRALVDAHELFVIRRREPATKKDYPFLLTIQIGKVRKLKGETMEELVEFAETYYKGFLKSLGVNNEKIS